MAAIIPGREVHALSDQRSQVLKTVRLWGLSLISATAGAITVWLTNSLPYRILAFAITLLILGPLLWRYEKRHRDH